MAGFQSSTVDVDIKDETLVQLLVEREKKEKAVNRAKKALNDVDTSIRERLARKRDPNKRYVIERDDHIYTAQLNDVPKLALETFDVEAAPPAKPAD